MNEPRSAFDRSPPASPEAEEHVLACCLLDEQTLDRCATAGLTADGFYFPINRLAFETLSRLHAEKKPVTTGALVMEFQGRRSPEDLFALMALDKPDKIPTTVHAAYFIEKLKECEGKRRIIREATSLVEHAYNGTVLKELTAQAEWMVGQIAKPPAGEKNQKLLDELLALRVSAVAAPPEPITRLSLAGKPVATPGNLSTFTSRSKTGKTAATGAAVAAIIAAASGITDQDTFGFTAPNNNGLAVLVFDTEQSKYDAYTCYKRVLARAGIEKDPPWLLHFSLVGKSPAEIRAAIPVLFAYAASTFGGVFLASLDGVADLALSVNDEAEAKVISTELRSLSIAYDCPILCVIHSNEAIKAGDDARGHLGKELMRKAESNLLLKKSGEVTTITSEKQRKAPITEEDGVAFKWSDAEGRHVSCGSIPNPKDEAKRDRVLELAQSVFDHIGRPRGRYVEIVKAIETIRNVGGSRAEDRFTEMKKLGVIVKDLMGFWSISK